MESKLAAMSEFMAAAFLTFLFVGIWLLLEHNSRRTAGLPRAPFGADADRDTDLNRIRHDVDVTRQAR